MAPSENNFVSALGGQRKTIPAVFVGEISEGQLIFVRLKPYWNARKRNQEDGTSTVLDVENIYICLARFESANKDVPENSVYMEVSLYFFPSLAVYT